MGVREALNKSKLTATVVAVVVIVGALIAIILQTRGSFAAPGPGEAYYTIDDGKTVFTDKSGRIAPFDKDGKPAYRAHVFNCGGTQVVGYLSRYTEGGRLPGVVIVRFDAPLFFANGGIFDDFVRSRVTAAGPDIHTVSLAAEPITGIDTTAADELVSVDDWLAKRGIRLIIAEMKDPVKDVLRDYGLARRFPPDRFAPTVGAAVDDVTGTLRTDIEGTKWDEPDDAAGGGAADGGGDAPKR